MQRSRKNNQLNKVIAVVVSDPDGNMLEGLFEAKEAKGVNIKAYNG